MDNQYQFNGKTYTLKPLTLVVMKSAMPLLAKLRKLQYEYTKDIDMSEVNKSKNRLNELESAKKQLSEMPEDDISNDQRLAAADKINILNDKISAHKAELENNEAFTQKIKLFNECSAMAVYELISDIEIISPVIDSLLTEDGSAQVNIDYKQIDAFPFISRVLTDFFLLIQKNKLKLNG